MEARHQPHNTTKGGTHGPHKGYKKSTTPVGCAATVETDLFPPDPELVESAPPEPDHIEGLSLRITQAMNHYWKMFCVWGYRTLREGLSMSRSFPRMAQGTFKHPGVGQKKRMPQRTTPQISDQGHFLPRGGPIPGNRAYDKRGRAGDATGCDVRRMQSFWHWLTVAAR